MPELIAPALSELEQILVVTVNEADQDRTVINVISLLGLVRERRSHQWRDLHVYVSDHGQFLQRIRGRPNIGLAFEQNIILMSGGQQAMEFFIRWLLHLNHRMLNMMQFDEV